MSDPLWAPWRIEYILAKKRPGGCVFCVAAEAPEVELDERLVVHQGRLALVMLNRYPFAAGHLLIIPRRHEAALEGLAPDEHAALFGLVRDAVVRLKRALKCTGVNVGLNLGEAAGAGIAEHLHVHLVPRWAGDTNFMPVIADTRVVPQALAETRRHLLPHFADLSSQEASHV